MYASNNVTLKSKIKKDFKSPDRYQKKRTHSVNKNIMMTPHELTTTNATF